MRAVNGSGLGATHVGTIYVSPSGSGAACTLFDPCSVTTAVSIHAKTVNVLDGTYRIASALALTSADNGATWQAAVGAHPVFSGAMQVTGWMPGADAGANTIWSASVPAGTDSRQLFVNENRRILARYPNAEAAYTSLYSVDAGLTANVVDGGFIRPADSNPIQNWPDKAGIEFVGWADCQTFRARTYDVTDAGVFFYPLQWANTQIAAYPVGNWYAPDHYEHALELLDNPGEWFLKTSTGTLYYMPRPGEDMTTADVELPQTTTLLSVTGSAASFVADFSLTGIRFTGAGWTEPSSPDGGGGPNWCDNTYSPGAAAMMANPQGGSNVDYRVMHVIPAAVDMQWVINATVSGITVDHSGTTGVFLHNVQHSTVENSTFVDLSASAIMVADLTSVLDSHPETVDTGGVPMANYISDYNIVVNNVVDTVAREYYSSPGIETGYGNHNTVAQNSVLNVPSIGILAPYGHAANDDPGGVNGYDAATPTHDDWTIGNDVEWAGATPTGTPVTVPNMGRLMDVGGILTNGANPDGGITQNFVANEFAPYSNIWIDSGGKWELVSTNCSLIGARPNAEPSYGTPGDFWLFLSALPSGEPYPSNNDTVSVNFTDYNPAFLLEGLSTPTTYSAPTLISTYFDAPDAGNLGTCAAIRAVAGSSLRDPDIVYGAQATTSPASTQDPRIGTNLYGFDVMTLDGGTAGNYWQVPFNGGSHTVTEVRFIPAWNVISDPAARQNLRLDLSSDPTFGTYTTIGMIDSTGLPNHEPFIARNLAFVASYLRITKTVPGTFDVGEVDVRGH